MLNNPDATLLTNSWIAKIKANDEATLNALYVANFRKVEQYVLANSGDEDEARDVYQEAFISAWRNIQLDKVALKDESTLSGYIYTIARNKWLDELRKQKRHKTVPLADNEQPEQAAADEVNEEEAGYLDAVRAKFEQLGDQCREILKRFYFKKESMREIAATFGWTEPTAKNNKYRCLQRLREMVGQQKQ